MSTAPTSHASAAHAASIARTPPSPPTPHARAMPLALGAWCAAALAIAASGVMARLPVPVVPASIAGLVAAGVLLYRGSAFVGGWARAVDVRVLVLFHLVRVGFGAAFLVLLARGALPAEFARLAGPGDIVAGALAPLAAFAARAHRRPRRARPRGSTAPDGGLAEPGAQRAGGDARGRRHPRRRRA